jgi:hypothetical protein
MLASTQWKAIPGIFVDSDLVTIGIGKNTGASERTIERGFEFSWDKLNLAVLQTISSHSIYGIIWHWTIPRTSVKPANREELS